MKIVQVVGARPNFVKAAPLVEAYRQRPGMNCVLVHTGQHYDAEMSDSFFEELAIPRPDYNLEVGAASHTVQTAEVMKRLEPVLADLRPDVVVTVGDVNSTLAAALTAVKMNIAVAHVEAGLRSFDRTMPEEINRVVTDSISDFLFVSEPSGMENLRREGHAEEQLFFVGNVMIDTLRRFLPAARRAPGVANLGLGSVVDGAAPRYALLTLHRPALVDHADVFRSVWNAIQELAMEIPVVFPAHPRTQQRLREAGLEARSKPSVDGLERGIHVLAPLSYLSFLRLQSEATLVITDSGGVQEETTCLGVPCLTLRNNTERPITVTKGTNTIVGLNPNRLQEEAFRILEGRGKRGGAPENWDGHAAERIASVLENVVLGRQQPALEAVARA